MHGECGLSLFSSKGEALSRVCFVGCPAVGRVHGVCMMYFSVVCLYVSYYICFSCKFFYYSLLFSPNFSKCLSPTPCHLTLFLAPSFSSPKTPFSGGKMSLSPTTIARQEIRWEREGLWVGGVRGIFPTISPV